MSFPQPVPGQVIRYGYLWDAVHRRSQEEGVKGRMGLLANLFAVANSGDDKEPPGVLNLADDPVIADTVTPQSSLVAGQGFAMTAGVLVGGDADIEVASKLVLNVGIQLAQVPAGGAAEADFER